MMDKTQSLSLVKGLSEDKRLSIGKRVQLTELFKVLEGIDSWHYDGKFNSSEFIPLRDKYPLITGMFRCLTPLMHLYFKRGDTLASDENINPDYWNDQIIIFRRAYEKSFQVWSKGMMFDKEAIKQGKAGYSTPEGCYKEHYDNPNQKAIRLMIDLICTMMLEDTVYRELYSMWMFEMQYLMNLKFNPEIQQYHILYCNYFSNDTRYYEYMQAVGKGRRMTPEYHTKANHMAQEVYNTRKEKSQRMSERTFSDK